MPVPVAILNDLANSLRIGLTGPSQPAPGQTVSASIRPFLGDVQFTELLTGIFDLQWVTKDVRFNNALLEPSLAPAALNGDILGGLPISGGVPGLTGVPGLIGQLTGSMPIPSTTNLKVQVEAQWSVSSDPSGTNPLGEMTDFIAPQGLNGIDAAFVFRPDSYELTTAPPPAPVPRYLHASVRLTAGGTSTAWISLPAVPVLVPLLAVPKLLALFLHAEFSAKWGDDDGAVLIVVPATSPVGSLTQLQGVLDELDAVLSALTSFAGFAAFLAGLSELTGALPAQPHAQFRSTNSIGNLNDITLIQRAWYENDTEAEDELSSIIFIGPAGQQAQFFNARGFGTGEGAFTLTIGPNFFTLIRSLHGSNPGSEPEAMLTVDNNAGSFGDTLSSLRFS